MADYKKPINKHLGSAKDWLNKAQDSFEEEKDVRGELDLFLVQAELKHAQKLNRDNQPKYKYSALKHGAAFLTALFIFVFGISASYFYFNSDSKIALNDNSKTYSSNGIFLENEFSQKNNDGNFAKNQVNPNMMFVNNKSSDDVSAHLNSQRVSNEENNEHYKALQQDSNNVIVVYDAKKSNNTLPEKTVVNSSKTKDENLVSKEEFKNLIRSAGESLRGQN